MMLTMRTRSQNFEFARFSSCTITQMKRHKGVGKQSRSACRDAFLSAVPGVNQELLRTLCQTMTGENTKQDAWDEYVQTLRGTKTVKRLKDKEESDWSRANPNESQCISAYLAAKPNTHTSVLRSAVDNYQGGDVDPRWLSWRCRTMIRGPDVGDGEDSTSKAWHEYVSSLTRKVGK